MNFTTGKLNLNKQVLKIIGENSEKLGFCFQIDFEFLFYIYKTGNWRSSVIYLGKT